MSSKECSDRLVIHASGGTPRVSASTTLLSSSLAFAQDRDGWPSSFTVGTASQGGTYFAYGSGWANLVADQLGLSGGGEVTGGPTQNLALVHGGDVAFGLTTMGPARDALNGESALAPGMVMDNVCALFPMYETPFSSRSTTIDVSSTLWTVSAVASHVPTNGSRGGLCSAL
mgnify:CR=1 FL=1